MSKKVEDLLVLENNHLNDQHFILKLQSQAKLPEILPGQFVNVRVDGSKETFLRRPFSIHDVDFKLNTFSLLIKKVGKGTESLAYSKPGESLSVVYPLGNSFGLEHGRKCLLVGGGCGVAPLLYLARCLKENGNQLTILIGGKSSCDIMQNNEYDELGEVLFMTEDGSLGEKGLVTAHSFFGDNLSSFSKIYTCGPEPMMKAVTRLASTKDIPCEVSLENTMACGFGVCLCCVTETDKGRQCVCTVGPVFNSKHLQWQI